MPEPLLTLEEFEALPDDPHYRDEVSRGRLVREPPPSDEHGAIVVEFAYRLRTYLESHPGVRSPACRVGVPAGGATADGSWTRCRVHAAESPNA